MSNDKPDFSNVQGGSPAKPDFSNVQSKVTSTEAITEGGFGSTGSQTYTVQKGDNLSKIAERYYGRQDWKRIYDANRDLLDDPDKISPGQVLTIPAA
ncbi:LysM peptidoglycan-binding domain-containing protein [Thermomonas brevis]